MQKKESFLYRNGLSLVLTTIFLLIMAGQIIAGWQQHNVELLEDGDEAIGLKKYLSSAHFLSATFENWESEFLQMGMYVLLLIFLRQKGSAESKKLGEQEEVDREPRPSAEAPWPVRKGGFWLKLYSNSLSLAFLFLFIFSFVIHSFASHNEFNDEQIKKGGGTQTYWEYLCNSKLWFESFQNWQSEFIAVLSIVVLSIFLRQKGSPESKPVDASHSETGG